MNSEKVKGEFYEKLVVITELKLSGTDVYNVDEFGLTLVNRGGKIIAPKGSETVFMRKTGERSENTIVAACSATGTVTLPLMATCKGVRQDERGPHEWSSEGCFFRHLHEESNRI
jgi:hypothetical protein